MILLSKVMNEFVINEFLKLQLENGKTLIFIDDKKFIQCKYLLLNSQGENNENITPDAEGLSIDDQTSDLDHSLELVDDDDTNMLIPPEAEFWAHCSNLQAWYENDYNTHILHSNLAFPLLRRLTAAGDKKAGLIFKEEISRRFKSGNLNVMTYLVKEGYLDQLDIEESDKLYEELNFNTYKELKRRLKRSNKEKEGFII